MADACPTCGSPYGVRRRCYVCKPAKAKTGVTVACAVCGLPFYAPAWKLADVARNSGVYCSNECKHVGVSEALSRQKHAGTIPHSSGYRLAWAPDHPRASRGRVLEHILVAEKELGRYLTDDEHVHHKDHVKTNNDPSNLIVLSATDHAHLHASERRLTVQSTRVAVACAECGKSFQVKRSKVEGPNKRNRAKFCSMDCRRKSWPREMAAKKAAKRAQPTD